MQRVLLSLVVLAAMSCAGPEPSKRAESAEHGSTSMPSNPDSSAPAKPASPRVVVLGDSLTAGLGIPREQAYPALLQRKLDEAGIALEVVNAGVSGDTSADGLRRTDWALEGDVRLLIVALGANDGLRGLPAGQMKANLESIIQRARQRDIPVLLVGMEAPPNYGERYATAFRQVYRDLARENSVTFVPFLLEGVAGVRDLNQPDGVHPTSTGAARIADHLWPVVKTMIEK